MKIVFIISGLSVGGAETMLLKLLMHLDPRISPYVVSLTTLGDIGARIRDLGIPVVALGMNPKGLNPILIVRLIWMLHKVKPHVVHTWLYHSDLIGGLASRMARVPYVVWGIHHTDLSRRANKRLTLLVVRVCSILSRWVPDRIAVCSRVAMDVHVSQGYVAKKMRVIPNGFELSRFVPDSHAREDVRAELKMKKGQRLVGVIGRFHPQKNQVGFVQAMSKIHGRDPDVHFLLAGSRVDGENSILMQAIAQNALGEVTHLLGQRDDVPRLMAALDVLALPSIGEAFPSVLGEAMACGVPCAVMDVGDSAMIVGDTGRVVSAGDMVGLAESICELLNLTDAEMIDLRCRARARIADLFEIGAIVKQYELLYGELRNPVCAS